MAKFFLSITLLAVSQWALAESTTETLAKVDSLVSKRAYQSAMAALGTANTDPALVAKKTELCLKYFVQSINHQLFAFKDLVGDETLDGLRSGTGTFTLYHFDPVAAIEPLLVPGPTLPLLYKELGDYYYEVSLRYQGRWIKTDTEVAQLAVSNYMKAFEGGVNEGAAFTNCADKASELGDFATALGLYQKAFDRDPTLYNVTFNLAYSHLRLGHFADALAFGDKAIERYRDDPNFQMDAFLLCSDAGSGLKDYARALAYLDRALAISDRDYRVYQKQAYARLAQGNLDGADVSLDRLFALAPTNPGATQLVTQALEAFGQQSREEGFFVRNLKKFASQPEVVGNLSFHQALGYEGQGDHKRGLEAALRAKASFVTAQRYDGQIRDATEALIARNSQ